MGGGAQRWSNLNNQSDIRWCEQVADRSASGTVPATIGATPTCSDIASSDTITAPSAAASSGTIAAAIAQPSAGVWCKSGARLAAMRRDLRQLSVPAGHPVARHDMRY